MAQQSHSGSMQEIYGLTRYILTGNRKWTHKYIILGRNNSGNNIGHETNQRTIHTGSLTHYCTTLIRALKTELEITEAGKVWRESVPDREKTMPPESTDMLVVENNIMQHTSKVGEIPGREELVQRSCGQKEQHMQSGTMYRFIGLDKEIRLFPVYCKC